MFPLCLCFLIFVIYGFLTPFYSKLLKGKMSNEKGFYIAWTTAPYLVSYFYSPLFLFPLLIFFNVFSYVFAIKLRINFLVVTLFLTAIVGELIYSLVFQHTNYA